MTAIFGTPGHVGRGLFFLGDAHDLGDYRTNLFAFFERRFVVAEFIHGFVALESQICGSDKDKWISGVHHGNLERPQRGEFNLLSDLTCGEEFTGHGTTRPDEIEQNLGTISGNAVDVETSLTDKLPVFHLKFGKDYFFRIGVVDAYLSDGLDGFDEAAQQSEGPTAADVLPQLPV